MATTPLSKIMLWIFLMLNSFPMLSFSCLIHQKEALLQFKSNLTTILNTSSTASVQLDALDSWNSTSDCCTWDYVICDITMAITQLDLYKIVPESDNPVPVLSDILTPLFHIRSLNILDLSWNSLQGQIFGDGFGNLTRLVQLDMSYNNFNGSIPRQLLQLSNLKVLDLSQNPLEWKMETNIEGSIPSQIFQLESLEYLDLSKSGLQGVLSTEVGKLRNIESLVLNDNLLSGNIPEEIGKLAKLRELHLRNNQFTGGIPSFIINLKELDTLDLSGNSLSMKIPPCIGSWLPNMEKLDLRKNQFTGPIPASIQNLSKLEFLRLDHNKLAGDIPTWLFNISTLRFLYIGGEGSNLIWNNKAKISPRCSLYQLSMTHCGISGQIPEWISSQLRSLHFLDLSMNQLEGNFPDMLIQTEMEVIVLSDNNLTGSLPPGLFDIKSLEVLVLSRNNFSGELPNNIGSAAGMEILMLSENNLCGKLPKSMSNMYGVHVIDLSGNRFSGDSFPMFRDYHTTTYPCYFDFSNNDFYGTIPTSFPTSTRVLLLGRNRFSGDLPSNLTKLINLQTLDVHGNDITGNFQTVLPQIPTLQVLLLSENSLRGFIPTRISNLSSLRILDLSGNNLTGSIPQEIANLETMVETPNTKYTPFRVSFSYISSYDNIQDKIEFHDLIVNWKNSFQGLPSHSIGLYSFMDLSDNRISGEIPSLLGNLKGLKVLNISHNNISGHIPVSFGNLTHMESLDLSHNNISGTIPDSLEKLDELSVFNVSNNRLTGKIPMGGHMSTLDNPEFYANNSGLCGMQINITCSADIPPPDENEEKDQNLSWIIWEGSWFGFPVGFFSSIFIWGYLLNFLQFFKFW